MKCKKAERLLLRSIDGLLNSEEKTTLEKHLKDCPLCQSKQETYQTILDALNEKEFPDPQPYFWERLQPKLKEKKKYEPWPLWKQWGMRAIPLSLFLVAVLAAVIIFFLPHQKEELSQSETLLLRNLNPFQETTALLGEEQEIEDKNMMLIFTAMEEQNGARRYLP